MTRWIALGFTGAAMLLLAACGGDSSPIDALGGGQEPTGPPLEVISIPLSPGPGINGRTDWFGAQSLATIDILMTARDDRAWGVLWQLVHGKDGTPGDLPEGAMAVGVFLGQRPTGGYTVSFESVTLEDGQVIARYIETEPPSGAIVSQALTAPYAVRLVRASDAPVQFVRLSSGSNGSTN